MLSGYRPAALIAAKTSAALVQAVAVGAYAAIVLLFFWRPANAWTVAVTFMLAAATYAAFGLLIGVLVRGDLEGFFLIIMISLLDTFMQDPVGNPLANKPILEFFPSYGPTQFAVAGAFDHRDTRRHGRHVTGLDGGLCPGRSGSHAPAHAPACAGAHLSLRPADAIRR